ncbi:hypothetical protein CBR_g30605 [Chara braunii]|uniref:Protein kinase domain-containing protein n=1 Tax=Chara braunii TaxID=69332 RepID=A0A388LD61_CHABU|nr:hypothetical protein CBR_g30605 [Chara braunii]|eukprot:GBG80240.1 hypothetical protein CBR_g30605 [Chara braunii]
MEISVLRMLNQNDPEDKHKIVRLIDNFVFQYHLCLVFELLDCNLYEVIKKNEYKGLSLSTLRIMISQVLDALVVLRDANVIHCDLKPENILLKSLQPFEIKLIDFGSACLENLTVYSYIQSRFYRSPEVVLGHPYTTAIDMWSLGCVAAELFLGIPLFPGVSEYDLLFRMLETLDQQPPDHILRAAKKTSKYFRVTSSAPPRGVGGETQSIYQFLSPDQYEEKEKEKPAIGKKYFFDKKLDRIILNYPLRQGNTEEDQERERQNRRAFVDFLEGLLHMDPVKRWSPRQAVNHPFLTEAPFYEPYRPPQETPRRPVGPSIAFAHNPTRGGHWANACLSPMVNHVAVHPFSPNYGGYGPGSHGSFGSYSSYGENTGMGSSYGSYEANNMYLFATPPSSGVGMGPGSAGQPSTRLGVSPERRLFVQVPANVSGTLGISPSTGGGYRTVMPLGPSPSQFTPPGSLSFSPHGSSPQQFSPVRQFGPSSPRQDRGAGSNLRKDKFKRRSTRAMAGHGGVTGAASGSSMYDQASAQWPRVQQPNGSTVEQVGFMDISAPSGPSSRGGATHLGSPLGSSSSHSLAQRRMRSNFNPETGSYPGASVGQSQGRMGHLPSSSGAGSGGCTGLTIVTGGVATATALSMPGLSGGRVVGPSGLSNAGAGDPGSDDDTSPPPGDSACWDPYFSDGNEACVQDEWGANTPQGAAPISGGGRADPGSLPGNGGSGQGFKLPPAALSAQGVKGTSWGRTNGSTGSVEESSPTNPKQYGTSSNIGTSAGHVPHQGMNMSLQHAGVTTSGQPSQQQMPPASQLQQQQQTPTQHGVYQTSSSRLNPLWQQTSQQHQFVQLQEQAGGYMHPNHHHHQSQQPPLSPQGQVFSAWMSTLSSSDRVDSMHMLSPVHTPRNVVGGGFGGNQVGNPANYSAGMPVGSPHGSSGLSIMNSGVNGAMDGPSNGYATQVWNGFVVSQVEPPGHQAGWYGASGQEYGMALGRGMSTDRAGGPRIGRHPLAAPSSSRRERRAGM